MNKRSVEVYEIKYNSETRKREKELIGRGMFHQFGVNFEEFDAEPGNYSTAIVEMPDGSVQNVPVEFIKFVSPMEPE